MIYDCGYNELRSLYALSSAASRLDAIVIDVRLFPRSGNPQFEHFNLTTVLGERYVWDPDLGNEYYRLPNMIKIRDFQRGVKTIVAKELHNHVILMCACKQRSSCHRLEIVRLMGRESTYLDLALAKRLSTD